ncbi:MAG: crossover junction endodeoxyribonuclease RuvC [archaeon]
MIKIIILGIDPGYDRVGYGIVEKNGNKFKEITYGVISTSAKKKFIERVYQIDKKLNELVKKYSPEYVGVEKLFFQKNKTTAMKVSEARGIIMLNVFKNNLEIFEFTPNQIKQAVTGYGKADKKQIQFMIKNLLKLEKIPKPDDAADALGVALCTGQHIGFNNCLKKAIR